MERECRGGKGSEGMGRERRGREGNGSFRKSAPMIQEKILVSIFNIARIVVVYGTSADRFIDMHGVYAVQYMSSVTRI